MTDLSSELPPALLSVEDRRALGHARRGTLSRSAHAEWAPASDRADPVAQLRETEAGRLNALLPLRYGRMAVNPFAFFRGAAAVMAADLGAAPNTSLRTQLCGDAHLANFGAVSGLTGDALFDVNDFDETLPGPFEWDIKRLAASLVVAGRVQDLSDKSCRALARRAVHAYRRELTIWRQHRRSKPGTRGCGWRMQWRKSATAMCASANASVCNTPCRPARTATAT